MYPTNIIGVYKGVKYRILDELPSDFYIMARMEDCEEENYPIPTFAVPCNLVTISTK